ncbi:hypothetical protein D3C71_1572310 [compost metagenome]
MLGNLLELLEVLHPNHADTVGSGLLIALGTHDDFFGGEHASVGPGNDRQRRIDPRLQRRTDLADALLNRDQVGGLAPELGRQQGVLDGQRSHAGALQFDDRAHDIQRVAIAVVGVSQHRQLRHATNTGGLLDELAEGDQGEVRCSQYLQRSDRTTEDADLEAQVCGNACRHRVEHRCGVITGT